MILNPIEEIKQRLDIVNVISSYLKLQKTGANYRALCPFHHEKTPSFFVSPSKQIWKCFGCGKSGDIFKFIMEIEGVEFGDALKILAEKAGVDLKPYKKEISSLKTEKTIQYEICELATRFFQKQLKESNAGKEVKQYLLSRKLSEESIEKWRLGYSPDNWHALFNFLISKGYKREDIEKSGLVIKTEQGNYYDRFRGRIIFPIFDLNSQVIGFGGRIFKEKGDKDQAKYINTPNTLLYDKSRVLYGANFGKLAIKQNNFCILAEGYIDVILSHQAGFENTVGVSGTALSLFQLNILKRYTNNLFTAFDMDLGGNTATLRSIELAKNLDFNIKVILMPQDKDPADIISKDPKEWEKLIKEAKNIMDFYFDFAFSTFDKNLPEGKKEISKFLLPKIKTINNEIVKAHWVQKLAEELNIKEDFIFEELKKTKIDDDFQDINFDFSQTFGKLGIEITEKTKKDILEERIIGILLKYPEKKDFLDEDFKEFISSKNAKILELILSNIEENEFLNKIKELNIEKIYLDECVLQIEILFENLDDKKIKEDFLACQKELKKIFLKEKIENLIKEIEKAERNGDQEILLNLTCQLNTFRSKLNKL